MFGRLTALYSVEYRVQVTVTNEEIDEEARTVSHLEEVLILKGLPSGTKHIFIR